MRAEAIAIYKEDVAVNRAMGKFGAEFIKPSTVLTHCNAGALATAGYGTALASSGPRKRREKDPGVRRSDAPISSRLAPHRVGTTQRQDTGDGDRGQHGGDGALADQSQLRGGGHRSHRRQRGRREQNRHLSAGGDGAAARRTVLRRRAVLIDRPRLRRRRIDPIEDDPVSNSPSKPASGSHQRASARSIPRSMSPRPTW